MKRGRAAAGRGFGLRRWLAPALAVLALAPLPAAARELRWGELAVEARLDAEGELWLRERHAMVFTGDWNGGERSFRLGLDERLVLHGLWRIDPASGEPVALEPGDLARVDRYDWTDRRTLRWRSRLPSDPPFDDTEITYLLEYRLSGVLVPFGERYRWRRGDRLVGGGGVDRRLGRGAAELGIRRLGRGRRGWRLLGRRWRRRLVGAGARIPRR